MARNQIILKNKSMPRKAFAQQHESLQGCSQRYKPWHARLAQTWNSRMGPSMKGNIDHLICLCSDVCSKCELYMDLASYSVHPACTNLQSASIIPAVLQKDSTKEFFLLLPWLSFLCTCWLPQLATIILLACLNQQMTPSCRSWGTILHLCASWFKELADNLISVVL